MTGPSQKAATDSKPQRYSKRGDVGIALEPGGWLSFRSPLGETRMRAQHVVSISPGRGQLGYLQLEYRGGTLQFISMVSIPSSVA